ncbi:hypothetical protein F1654_08715 [Alkalicaulis satelles]|uniref:EAL domain-containing protein n=1 Tax=Alkalicaulis satelles TaxID=2609175 RepID=A0A5M6ZHU2_9PROT|nr:hypothetical protein [Alkalicaulis satelles]KAA5803870.1 hypothetical protein F1654_08715 [Alkalicaulis satelles]
MAVEPMDLHAALAQYRASVRDRDPLDATQIEFINLGPLRDRYGARWPQVRERIFDVCDAFVKRRLAPGDLAVRAATGFLVLPGPGRTETAAAFTARIERELQAFFLGVEHLQSLQVQARHTPLPAACLLDALGSSAMEEAAQAHEAAAAPDEPAPPVLPDFELYFEPVWTAASGFVALHAAEPAGVSSLGAGLMRGHALAPSAGGAAMRMELDRRVLMAAARAWREGRGGAPGVLAAPVHYETLAQLKCRLPYLASFSALEEAERKAVMALIRASPVDAPYTRLTEVCRSAKALFPRVIVEIDLMKVKLDRFVDARADVFFFTAPGPAPFSAPALEAISRLSERAARLGARTAMGGCCDAAQLAAALDAGVHYISGPLTGEPARRARPPYQLDLTATAPGPQAQGRQAS